MKSRMLGYVLLLLAVASTSGFAFVPKDSGERSAWRIPRLDDEAIRYDRFIKNNEALDTDLDSFRERVGGNWMIQRSPMLGTPHHVLGSGIQYVEERIETAGRAEELSRAFLADHADFLMLEPANLGEPWIEHSGGKWTLVFRQTFEGTWVRGGRAHVVLTDDGRIYAIGSDYHSNIDVELSSVISETDAIAIAKNDLGFLEARGDFERESPEFFISPEMTGNGYQYRPTWKVILHMKAPFGGWETWVDANTGEIYARDDMYEYLDITGSVRGDVEDFDYCAGSTDHPLRDVDVYIVDSLGMNSVVADEDGNFTASVSGSDSVLVWTRFRGPFFRQFVTGNPVARDTVKVLPGEVADLTFESANSLASERDAWYHHWVIRDAIKSIDPGLTAADYQMPVNLDLTSAEASICPGNAFWNGTSTNFCAAAGSFANIARLGGVIYHEYGHGINQWTYSGSPFSGAQSEGNADVATLVVEHRPTLGIGFTNGSCNHGIRSANNTLTYPDDLNGGSHHDGMLISGYYWEARNRFVTTYGEAYADSVLPRIWQLSRKSGKPSSLPDQVTWFFIYDDDNGNINDGTPNYAELAAAAVEKGYTPPVISEGVQIAHTPLASTLDQVSSRTVLATITSLSAGVDPSTITMSYSVDGAPFTVAAMTPTANPDEYEATIPAASQASTVEYYLFAVDSAFHFAYSPANAPANTHDYDVAFLYDNCEDIGDWTLGDPGDDATNGLWVNSDPIGSGTRPEDDTTPDGTNCFVTGNTGNVKNGKTTLYSPWWNLGGADGALVRYDRWYSNNFGADGALETLDEYWSADASTDGGASWTMVENVANGSESWNSIEVDLGSLFGAVDTIQFRFVARDTGAATRIHAGVDEFRILIPTATDIAVGGGDSEDVSPRSFTLGANRPNPFNPVTAIQYDLPRKGLVQLDIFDVSGRQVRRLVNAEQRAGRHEVIWRGKNDSGEAVSSGVYFYRLRSGSFDDTRKMLLVR